MINSLELVNEHMYYATDLRVGLGVGMFAQAQG
jgi:hypothetical protein